MALSYELRTTTKLNSLRLRYTNKGQKFRITTKYFVNNINNWDSKKQRIKENQAEGVDRAKRFNEELVKFKSHYINEISKLEREQIQLTKELFSYISISYDGNTVQKERVESQFNYCILLKEWIKKAKNGEVLQDRGKFKGYPFSVNTLKNYSSILGHIEKFERDYYPLKPQQINKKLYNDLLIYARDSEEEYADGNLGAIIKNFKASISKLEDEYNIKFPNYKSSQWNVISPNALKIALNLDEITEMYNLDLSNLSESYSAVRDAYIFNALSSGARIGDYMNFNESNLLERGTETYLEYIQEKTGKSIVAPLPPICLSIIERHNGFPKIGSPQDANRKLKKIGKLCGFNEAQYLRDNKGKVIKVMDKWELLTNHTSRRSFCTIAYLNGMDTINIRAISGHGGEKILLEYINVSQHQHARRMQQTEHFKKITAINTLRSA